MINEGKTKKLMKDICWHVEKLVVYNVLDLLFWSGPVYTRAPHTV